MKTFGEFEVLIEMNGTLNESFPSVAYTIVKLSYGAIELEILVTS